MSPRFRSRLRIFQFRRTSKRLRPFLERLEWRVAPAVFTVTDAGDSGLPTQFRQLIAAANSNGEADTITFDASVTTINLTTPALPAYVEGFNLTIQGNGSGATAIVAPMSQRIFDLSSAASSTISISGFKLTGGNAPGPGGAIRATTALTLMLNDALITGNTASSSGGGVYLTTSGRLFATNSMISNNVASILGGAMSFPGAATFAMSDSTVSGNQNLGGVTSGGGGVYMSGGLATISNSTFSDNRSNMGGGGAVYFNSVTSVLSGCSFSNNSAGGTSGGAFRGGRTISLCQFTGNSAVLSGGAILSASATTIALSTFTNNSAMSDGGAITATTNTLVIDRSQFTGNTAGRNGGGLAFASPSATATINSSAFVGNVAGAAGGGATFAAVVVTINNSTFSKNQATGSSTTSGSAGGGAIEVSASITINNSTIVDNSATGGGSSAGGGILRASSASATFVLNSTVVANNTVTVNGPLTNDLYSNTAITVPGNNSFVGNNDGTNVTFTGTYQAGIGGVFLDPQLNAVGDNGGTTIAGGGHVQTMSLKAGSPLLDTGNNTGALTTDARETGYRRVVGSTADVGAFEAVGLSAIPDALLVAGDVNSASTNPFTFQVTYTDDVGLNTTTFNNSDITVSGPNGFSANASTVSFTPASGKTITVTYSVSAPPGGWGGVNGSSKFNIGNYTVTMNPSEVEDTDGTTHTVTAGSLGTFKTNFGLNLVVSSKLDGADDGNYSAGQFTFREALAVANSNVVTGVANTITFDTATMTSSTITLTGNASTSVNNSLVINGPSNAARVTINGNSASQNRFVLSDGQSLSISNINFTKFTAAAAGGVISFGNTSGSTVSLTNTDFTLNTSSTGTGGAIAIGGGAGFVNGNLTKGSQLTVINAVFANNRSTGASAGAINSSGAYSTITLDSSQFNNNLAQSAGGAIRQLASINTQNITISQSIFSGNTSTGTGGGGYFAGNITISNSVFKNNTAGSNGGGIRIASNSVLAMNQCSISGNHSNTASGASGGGGLYWTGGSNSALIQNSTFSSNVIDTAIVLTGGAVFYSGTVVGGWIVRQSTFSGNTSTGNGGGLNLNPTGTVMIQNSTIADNRITGSNVATGGGVNRAGGTINIESCIVSGNTLPSGSTTIGADIFASSSITINYTAVGDSLGFTPQGGAIGNQIGTPVGLKALASYGGFSLPDGTTIKTRVPVSGSPVRDAGSNPANLTLDQRGVGYPRLLGNPAKIDMGAVESQLAPSATLLSAANVSAAGSGTYSFQVLYTDSDGGNIDSTTFGTSDVKVTGPGFGAGQIPTSFSPSGSGSAWTVTYTIPAPANGWGSMNPSKGYNLGAYSVAMNANEVLDSDDSLSVAAGTLGTFKTGFNVALTVDNSGEPDDGDNSAGKLTLREAINLTNTNAGTDTINFNLPSGTTISVNTGYTYPINDNVSIVGPGANNLTIDMNFFGHQFELGGGHVVNISGLKLYHGSATFGGGIFVGQGDTLTLDRTWITGCMVNQHGGAIAINPYVTFSTAKVIVTNSTLSGNNAYLFGGAVYFVHGANVSISNSTLSNNASANVAGGGGAIGGQFTNSGSITLHNTTVTGNFAKTGGAIRMTPANYSAGILNIESSIISGNTASAEPGIYGPSYTGWMNSKTSVIQSMSGTINDQGGNLPIGTNPILGSLTNNGGATPTHALQSGSPAINAGSNPDILTTDQRGASFARVAGIKADMGAYEVQAAVAPPTVTSVVLNEGTGNANIGGVNGNTQRTEVRRIIVTFSEAVNFTGSVVSAFSLSRSVSSASAGSTGPVGLVTNPVNGPASSVTITFAGTYADGTGSLVDGLYNFVIDGSKVSGAGGQLNGSGGGAGTNYTVTGTAANKFFRYFGDQNGDGAVDQVDYLVFRNALANGPNSVFDYQNSGDVDQTDYLEFRNRLAGAP
ncbi:MAG: beta strand repeat-containing protein [Gemmataceae bacterium]